MSIKDLNTTDFASQPEQMLPDWLYIPLYHTLNYSKLFISLFGCATNILNIIVFSKIGLTTTASICLFSLAVSDLIGVVYTFLFALSNVPWFKSLYMPIYLAEVCYILAPVSFSCYAFGAWVTTVISLERSCSVVLPMKVKRIFTNKRVTFLLGAMLVYQLVSGSIRYFSIVLTTERFPGTNLTAIIVDFSRVNMQLSMLALTLSFSAPTSSCFCLVVLATIFLIVSLNKSRKKREKMTNTGNKSEELSAYNKDVKVIKTVILICTLFISGFFVTVAQFIATEIFPDLNFFSPRLGNIDMTLLEIGYATQTISTSINIFVYRAMNSTYRNVFNGLFNRGKEK